MNKSEETTVDPYKQAFDDARRKLDSSPKFDILKKLGRPEAGKLSPIPFPYGREVKTKYDFNAQ